MSLRLIHLQCMVPFILYSIASFLFCISWILTIIESKRKKKHIPSMKVRNNFRIRKKRDYHVIQKRFFMGRGMCSQPI